MSTMRWSIRVVAVLTVLSSTAFGQNKAPAAVAAPQNRKGSTACSPANSDAVWFVKTGGLWKKGGQYGNYRVLVQRSGIEGARDSVQVQVLEADDKRNLRRVRHCVTLDTPGLKGYVVDAYLQKVDDGRVAVALDVEMKAMYDLRLREVFIVTADGQATKVADAKYVDLD